jgi:hypothetical protein
MTALLLIGLIGLADLVRTGRRPRRDAVMTGIVVALLAVTALVTSAVHPLVVATIVGIAVAWTLLMPASDGDVPRRLWPAFCLLIVMVCASAVDRLDPLDLFPLDSGAGLLVGDIPVTGVVAVVGVALFLTSSGNIIARAALGRAARADGEVEALERSGSARWEFRVRGRVIGEVGEKSPVSGSATTLQGGRLIGPMERALIVILALVGAYVLIAALVAAKGVVRFPEISANRGVGSTAEQFLVGSLTSWSIATLAALHLASVIH